MEDRLCDLLNRWPPRFLRTSEAARFLALSARALEKHRCYGPGPNYRKLGGRVMYALADLKAWADIGTRESTSDPGSGTVLPAKPILATGCSRPQPSSNGRRKGRSSSHQLLATDLHGEARMTAPTHVELVWIKDRIENRIRFGPIAEQHGIDLPRRYDAPGLN